MRKWLRNTWYQAAWSDEVAEAAPLVRTILNDPILFFRKADGTVTAMLDRCPHRFAPLSVGKIDGDVVTCSYHGLAFGADGKCVRNPHGAITSAMTARGFPVVERHTALWVWTGDPALADPATIPDLSFIDETPEAARIPMYMPTKANYQLVVDNIMDLSHTDTLHPTTLGGIMTGAKASIKEVGETIVSKWLSTDCVPPPAFAPIVPPGARADIWTEVVWHAPALMVLGTGAVPTGVPRTPQDESFTLHNMVPETETTTHYFACNVRRFMVDNAGFTSMLKHAIETAFQGEDKPMLELQQDRMGTPDLWALKPILLRVDEGAVRVRRKLEGLIAAEDQLEAA